MKLHELSLTLTSIWGKGPLEFSGTLMGGMTQSLFCRLSPLAEEPLWCLRGNLITLGWESQTLDSISSMPTWKENAKFIISYCILQWITWTLSFEECFLQWQVGRWIFICALKWQVFPFPKIETKILDVTQTINPFWKSDRSKWNISKLFFWMLLHCIS